MSQKNNKFKENISIELRERGVIYARLSKNDRNAIKKSESIENQILMGKQWFKENKKKLIEIYVDKFRSGSDDNRPEFNRMLEDAKTDKFDFIWIKDYDRFARDLLKQEQSVKELTDLNIRLFSYFSPNADSLNRQLYGMISENYVRKFSQRVGTEAKKNALTLRKKMICRPILGYKMKKYQGINTGKWRIDKKGAEKVKDIFDMFVNQKKSIGEISSKHGKNSFGIKHILSNKKYIGIFEYDGKEIMVDMPLFLPEDLFNKAQEMLKNKSGQKESRQEFRERLLKDGHE